MENIFSSDNKLFNAVEKCIDLIKLNFIWMIFCIPVITIGASTCALHHVASRIAAGEDGYILQPFLKVFKQKFAQATRMWIPALVIGIGIAADYRFWSQLLGTIPSFMKGMVFALGAVYLFFLIYLFPLIARMDTSWKMTLRNAGVLAFKYLARTLYMTLWILIVFFAGRIWAIGMWLTFLAGGSIVALLHEYCLNRIFEKEVGYWSEISGQ
ncbi:MAG: DUF624 domain-containing protein [Lachnospiraceae bacterium]|nr:DUF624 domain-containing protein [Lachnospiraceae bacterium]